MAAKGRAVGTPGPAPTTAAEGAATAEGPTAEGPAAEGPAAVEGLGVEVSAGGVGPWCTRSLIE